MSYGQQIATANLGVSSALGNAANAAMQAKPPRSLVENIDELEKRLGEFSGRAARLANAIGGHSLQAVGTAGEGSTGPRPTPPLQQRVATLVRILGDCEESFARIESAVG